VPEPATADTARPTGDDVDVVDLLLTQHARIEELFTLVTGSTGEAREEAFHDLVRLLAVHETAEEEIVHPLSRSLGDDAGAMVDERLDEEKQAKQMLLDLIDGGPQAPGFTDAVLLLRAAVLTHARYEERYEFPRLRAKLPADRLRAAAATVRLAESIAPTRPHPGAQSATANAVLGPPLAVFDRARDALRDARE